MKKYGVAKFPQKGAAKKFQLKDLAIAVEAPNKKTAVILTEAEFIKCYSEHAEYYFDAKVWEDRPGLPRPPFNKFCDDFFITAATWDKTSGEPLPLPADATAATDAPPVIMKWVRNLGQDERAACLAICGPAQRITDSQYSQVIDFINDDERSRTRELYDAIRRVPRALTLLPFRQTELIIHLNSSVKEAAQWPEFHKAITDWLDALTDDPKTIYENVDAKSRPATETDVTLTEGDTATYQIHADKTEPSVLTSEQQLTESMAQPEEHCDTKQAPDAVSQDIDAASSAEHPVAPSPLLTYKQQLTLAALQGLCANPACYGAYDDLPVMATTLASSVLRMQEE
ncbi:hypothetical protein [Serratia rhizosphaerae]|uniref:Uncharacterized protein n=1 Tax=Serratia rhizosphaerae TaxID=2597702 RepID=A0ABX6GHI7_9GAMM|nr:hypothetical protein [Serratia rhizosphaerae]QHA85731.1 hypothetical protein FO014_01370 [Serratia rhizosphaerae]